MRARRKLYTIFATHLPSTDIDVRVQPTSLTLRTLEARPVLARTKKSTVVNLTK